MDHTTYLGCYLFLTDRLHAGKYRYSTITQVLEKDPGYVKELIDLGMYLPSPIARDIIERGAERYSIESLSRLDDEYYYQQNEAYE